MRKGGALAESEEDVHGIVRSETQVPDRVSIRSKQKRDSEECSITLDLALDTGAVTIDFNFSRQCPYRNQVPVAHVVENRVRRYLSGQFRDIGNWEALPYIRVRSDQGNDLMLSIRGKRDRKRDAYTVSFHYSWNTSRHLPHPAFQSRSKLESLHSSRCNPDIGVASIDKPGRCPQKANQETPLKHHSKYRKRYAQHGHREARPAVNDILPGKFHKSKLSINSEHGEFVVALDSLACRQPAEGL